MDLNFNIADLFNALQEFKRIVEEIHQAPARDEFERKRLKAAMALAKADIEELFGLINVD